MYKGLAHVAFTVKDMEKSLHFYCDVLGCKKIFELPEVNDMSRIVYLRVVGGQYVELFYGGERPLETDSKSICFFHVCFEVDDIKEIIDKITNAGIELLSPLGIGKDLGEHCMAKDPDGNIIEFMTMHPDGIQMTGKMRTN